MPKSPPARPSIDEPLSLIELRLTPAAPGYGQLSGEAA